MNPSEPDIDALDRFMTRALRARPEVRPVPHLALRATERAAALDRLAAQQRRSLAMDRWRLRVVYTAATIFISGLLLLGGHRLLTERQAVASADETTSTNETVSTSSESYGFWLGGLLFICTLAGVGTIGSIAPDRPSLVL